MLRYLLPLLVLAAPLSAAGAAFIDPRISVAHGAFCAVETFGESPAPETAAGKIDLYDDVPRIRWHGQIVPAHGVMTFGIVSKSPDGAVYNDVEIILRHPPFRESGVTEQRYLTVLGGAGNSINAYSFDFPEEMVPGTWEFEAIWQGETLYKIPFEVVPASMMPDMISACLDRTLTS
ncbi:DUF3859 domain-containing protein [Aestuariibius sp. 2305UL40-4]|uniref:DUF3859 domain-containing protein n=1 Tax=Aestuariibius violaceus TaxID=3234132 RepID=UPI00345E92B6